VNSKVKVKASIPTLVDESHSRIEAASDIDKAEMLNKFFAITFTSESFDTVPGFQDQEFLTSLDDILYCINRCKHS